MDFLDERDATHPVRWSPMTSEPDRWLSVGDAVERLTRDGTDKVLAEQQLRSGLPLRTMFALYSYEPLGPEGTPVTAEPGSLAGRLLGR